MPRIAVELPSEMATPGEFLADVQAYEAADADTVWLAPGSLEPLTLLAAAAAVTFRVRLGVTLTTPSPWPPSLLAAVVETLRQLSRDRVLLGVQGEPAGAATADHAGDAGALWEAAGGARVIVAGAGQAAIDRAAELGAGLVCELAEAAAAFEAVRARRGEAGGEFELWVRVAPPAGRAAWREAVSAAEELGATGLLVPHAPNLLDILRNPQEDDRQDLGMAVG